MTRRHPTVLVCSLLILHLLASAATGQEVSRGDLKKQFESRYPRLVQLKTEGKIGETWAGLVAVVEPRIAQDEEIAAIIREENDDRRTLYRLLSDEVGNDANDPGPVKVAPEIIAERNAWRNFERASPTEMLGAADATWVTKKQRPWLLGLLKLEDKGRVGETSDGYVAVVRREFARDGKVSRILELENEARRKLYERLARAESLPLETIAGRQARRQFKAAHAGVFLRADDGTWQPKRDPSGVLPGAGGRD
jgi:uncharacterized protein YdbL (DUF1318 family)